MCDQLLQGRGCCNAGKGCQRPRLLLWRRRGLPGPAPGPLASALCSASLQKAAAPTLLSTSGFKRSSTQLAAPVLCLLLSLVQGPCTALTHPSDRAHEGGTACALAIRAFQVQSAAMCCMYIPQFRTMLATDCAQQLTVHSCMLSNWTAAARKSHTSAPHAMLESMNMLFKSCV